MRYTFAQLSQFVAVVEEGSFTAASARLGVAQPWLSTRVRQLEQRLGLRLLDRSPRGVAPTVDGALFYDGALAILRKNHELAMLVSSLTQRRQSNLQIGAIAESIYIDERDRLLDGFRATFPHIETTLVVRSDPELRLMVARGELDAAFITGRPSPGLEAQIVRSGQCELLLPFDHPLSGLGSISLSDLKGMRVGTFARERNPAAWDETAGRLQDAGALLSVLAETLRPAFLAHVRRTGEPVLAVSSFGAHDPHGTDIVSRPILAEGMHADFYLVRRAEDGAGSAADRFWRYAENATRAAETQRTDGLNIDI